MSSRHKVESWIILNPKEGGNEEKVNKEQIEGKEQVEDLKPIRPIITWQENYLNTVPKGRHCQTGCFKKQDTALKLPIRNSDEIQPF